ncbi:protein BatD [Candidatus Dependentiae bacterium]|nr:protein BatD [Candidatus Dependentiae bacterium]
MIKKQFFNSFLFFLLCGLIPNIIQSQQGQNSLTISITGSRSSYKDNSGKFIYEIDPGQIFNILVISSGKNPINEIPEIPGLDQFRNVFVRKSGRSMNINGKTSLTNSFEFQAIGGDEGEFEIGPISTSTGKSESCVIKVRQRTLEEADAAFQKEYKAGVACQARLVLEKDTFFVGEIIPVTLQVYVWNDNVEINHITPQFDSFTVKESDTESSTIQIENRPVKVFQKKFFLSTPWAGTKKIKPVTVAYSQIEDDFPFNNINFNFFGPTKSIMHANTHSNGLSVTIKDTPQGKRSHDAIGSFSQLTLSVDKNMVDLRTPINLCLKVRGNGNFDAIEIPRLKLPRHVRSFPGTSESKVSLSANGEFEKKFTYVIQPIKPGVIKIPSQEFYFFDPKTESFSSISSNQLTISVDGDEEETAQEKLTPDTKTENSSSEDKESLMNESDEEWLSSEQNRKYEKKSDIFSGLTLFVLGLLSFLFGIGYFAIYRWILWHKRNPSKALAIALKEIHASATKNAADLFRIAFSFCKLKLFNDQLENPTFEEIEAALNNKKCSKQIIAIFMATLEKLAGGAFGSQTPITNISTLRQELEKVLHQINNEL